MTDVRKMNLGDGVTARFWNVKRYSIQLFHTISLIHTAPNTMICCTVYTKRVRKNNTSTYTNLSLKHCIVKCALYQHYAVFEY